MAIGVSLHCDSCVSFHTHDALEAGAFSQEILAVLGVIVLMGGGPSVMYATHVVEAADQFENATAEARGRDAV